MEMLDEMRELLREKTACFLQYEEESRHLITDDPDDVDAVAAAVEMRQALIGKIDGIDGKLRELRDSSLRGNRLYEIMKNRCDYGGLDEGETRLFADGQELFKIMTRIRELEGQASECMAKLRDELQDKIKKNNVNSRFTGYLKQMDQKTSGMLYDKKR